MSKTLKQPKRKEELRYGFAKGTRLVGTEKANLIDFLQQPTIEVYLKVAGRNNDDTEFLEIRIDGIKTKDK